jgi:hypothetical protein
MQVERPATFCFIQPTPELEQQQSADLGCMDAKPRLFENVRHRLRARHYSYRTEQQYLGWISALHPVSP